MKRRTVLATLGLLGLQTALPVLNRSVLPCAAQEKTPPENKLADAQGLDRMISRGVDYLKSSQADDGSFSSQTGVGPTALAAAALLAVNVSPDDPVVAKSLAYLLKHAQSDGGVYATGSRHQNYDSCLALVAFTRANKNGKYDQQVKRLEAYVKQQQWDEGEGKTSEDPFYGGAGYGSKARPDLSNTGFLVEALHELGRDGEDEAIKRALTFVSRCQNLESPANQMPFAAKVNDGGFVYTTANGGESMAGADASGGLRSYGSMTYAGLKSMIYAGVSKDDPRVKAAIQFLQKNYTVDSNPGMGQSGHFYYLQTMSKALQALGGETFKDSAGKTHTWRNEIVAKLAQLQQANGSWVNAETRWMEGDPNLVTSYVLLTLANCK